MTAGPFCYSTLYSMNDNNHSIYLNNYSDNNNKLVNQQICKKIGFC